MYFSNEFSIQRKIPNHLHEHEYTLIEPKYSLNFLQRNTQIVLILSSIKLFTVYVAYMTYASYTLYIHCSHYINLVLLV